MSAHTQGEWMVYPAPYYDNGWLIRTERGYHIAMISNVSESSQNEANARLIAAAPTQHAELLRYLPIIERAEADPELWARLTEGTGIATANGYRAAIARATQGH